MKKLFIIFLVLVLSVGVAFAASNLKDRGDEDVYGKWTFFKPIEFRDGITVNGTVSGFVNNAMGNVFYVDSGTGQDSSPAYGTTKSKPFASIDYAIGKCTADNGDFIIVAAGHNESLGNAQIDADVAGITIIGCGNGSNRPRIDFDHANASFDVGADNVRISNIQFLPSVTGVLIGIDIESGSDYTVIDNCEFLEGEDGSGVDEFVTAIEIKGQAATGGAITSYTQVINNKYFGHASNASADFVIMSGVTHGVQVKGNLVIGDFSTAAVSGESALGPGGVSTLVDIEDNKLYQLHATEPSVDLVATTTGIIADNYMKDGTTSSTSIVCSGCFLFENYWSVGASGESTAVVHGDNT